jgi:dTDP-4-amino-4,6-dideoxygalactose transaminase
VIDNAGFILGKEVADFEQEFAAYAGAHSAVGVASGTAALHLALLAIGIRPGDEVIAPAHTFIATAEPISHTGARPVFVDIDSRTYNIDPQCVIEAITPRTRAIVAVHIYGQPSDLKALRRIADSRGLRLIEDAAQAHGAEVEGRRCGSIGDLSCFSFYPGKNLGAYGDGGAVTGNDEELLHKVRMLRDHGRTTKYEHDEIGFGERLDTIQAAILRVKLRHLDRWTEQRRSHAAAYNRLLAGAGVVTPYESPDCRHVYHLYVIRSARRQALLDHLKSKGIGAGVHYPIPLHRQPAYLKQGYGSLSLPVTERVTSEIVSLPMYPELTETQIEFVASAVKEAAV